MTTRQPRVLYVTGMTRCGSTMLGNVLNEIPGVVHLGELHYLWCNGILRSGTNTSCGCGADVGTCPVWSPVLASPEVPHTAAAAREVVAAQQRRLQTRHTPRRVAEARGSIAASAGVHTATGAMAAVYRAVDEAQGAPLIVDSSKYPAEAAALCARGDIDLRILHMVRDPRATAYSYQRSKSYIDTMPPWRVIAEWSGVNMVSELLRVVAGERYLRIRHEDFGWDPRGVVDDVRRFAGIAGPNPVDGSGRVELGDNHTVTGNPDRLNRGAVEIRCDERWRTELGPAARAVATAGAALPMYHYGYVGSPRPGAPEHAGRT